MHLEFQWNDFASTYPTFGHSCQILATPTVVTKGRIRGDMNVLLLAVRDEIILRQ